MKEKEDRDRVRRTLWDKLVEVDGKVESINEYLTSQIQATADYNEEQDKRMDELKALIQEVSAIQQEMSASQNDIEKEAKELRKHLDNGWKQDLIDRQSEQVFKMMETLGKHSLGIREQKEQRTTKIWMEILKIVGAALGTGGFLYLILQNLMR